MKNKQSSQEPLEGEVLENTQPIRSKERRYGIGRRKKILLSLIGLTLLIVPLVLLILFIMGAGAVSGVVLPILLELVAPLAIVSFVVLLPLGYAYKPWRERIGRWLYVGSFVYGVCVWLLAFIVTLEYWGVLGVLIGFILLGIGMVPVGALAAIFNFDWLSLGVVVALLGLTFGSRYYGMKLMRMR